MGRLTIWGQKVNSERNRKEKKKRYEFEVKIRKYYPKKSISLYHGSHYQRMCVDNFDDPKSLIVERYKRSFFRRFDGDGFQLCHIPNNLRHLKVRTKSTLIFKKLIKQNKRLESIDFTSFYGKTAAIMVKYLKYTKSLRSIKFQSDLPLKSETECKKMRNTWGKRIENMSIGTDAKDSYFMKTIFQLPRLQDVIFRNSQCFFPDEKLQERNIAYSICLELENNNSLLSSLKNQPNFELVDYVNIEKVSSSDPSKKMSLERRKIERSSKQKHFLRYKNQDITVEVFRKPIFQNIVSLDLTVSGDEWANSSIKQLDNLKHLSIYIDDYTRSEDSFEDFFAYLNQNVAPHRKLETFLMKATVGGSKKSNKNLAAPFFEACSATLKKVHLEFKYHDKEFDAAECFYEGLKKLKNLQSLGLFLDLREISNEKAIKIICKVIPKLKSLKEMDFNIQKNTYQGKSLSLKFPSQLKMLSLGMDTSGAPFDSAEALWPLSKLTHLEFQFIDFCSPKWSKVLHDIGDKNKYLEVLILKKTEKLLSKNETAQIRVRLNGLMKKSSSLKLIVFAEMTSSEMMIFKRKNDLWLDINPMIKDVYFKANMKVNYIQCFE